MLKHKVYNKAKGEFEPRQTAVTNDGGLIIRSVGRGWFEPADPENYHILHETPYQDVDGKNLWEGDTVSITYLGEPGVIGFIEVIDSKFYVNVGEESEERVVLERAIVGIKKLGGVYEPLI